MNMSLAPLDLQKMRSMAGKVARRTNGDQQELAKDLMQDGWLAYYETDGKPLGIRWTAARWAMFHAWRQWEFGAGQAQKPKDQPTVQTVPLLDGLDFAGPGDLESDVYVKESLARYVAVVTDQFRKPDKYVAILKLMIEQGGPHLTKSALKSVGLSPNAKWSRLPAIQEIMETALTR